MNQEILTFFEDVGMLCRRKYLDDEMIWDTFGHFAEMWWSACRDYIEKEQRNMPGNTFVFKDFKFLVQKMWELDIHKKGKTRAELEPSPSEVEYFCAQRQGHHQEP